MEYVGAIGVQDRLAPGTISTIKSLRKAGVKVCIASGDNLESCMSVAFNCKIASMDTPTAYLIDTKDEDECMESLKTAIQMLIYHSSQSTPEVQRPVKMKRISAPATSNFLSDKTL
jgi:magnesium-transporting ATPase (P-type)